MSRPDTILQKPVTPTSTSQSDLDEPSASLRIQSAYRGVRVKKVYGEFKNENQAIDLVETTLRNTGYNGALEALQIERDDKKSKWAEKLKSVNRTINYGK